MTIRHAHPSEAEAVETVLIAAFADYMQGLGRDWVRPVEWMADRLAAGQVRVSQGQGGAILGVMVLSHDPAACSLTIDMLATAPDARGQGHGRRLLADAEALARAAGARTLLLHTVAKYRHLLDYYQAAGFEITHHGPRPKGDDGHPRAFLRKWLVANRETTA